jgi:hypothetical protein
MEQQQGPGGQADLESYLAPAIYRLWDLVSGLSSEYCLSYPSNGETNVVSAFNCFFISSCGSFFFLNLGLFVLDNIYLLRQMVV